MTVRSAALSIAVLGLLAYAPFLSRTDLLNPDEPRYALVAREMLESGNWLVPTLRGKTYGQKPPVFFWSIAALGALRGGVDETAARLPSVISAIVTLLAVFMAARRMVPDPERGVRVGLMAAAVLGTTTRFLVLASRANIDGMLTMWTTLAFWAFLAGYPLHGGPARPRWMALGFALAGLSVITKGTGGLLFLLGIVAFLVLARERAGWRTVPWVRGIAVLLAVAAAWALPALIAGGAEDRHTLLYQQMGTRVVDPWTHARPWYFYSQTLPQNFLPWTLFVPVAAWALGAALLGKEEASAGERRGLWFCLAVFGSAFLFFSSAPSKRDYYLLPALPWLSAAVAWGMEREMAKATLGWRVSCWATVALAAVAGLGQACWTLCPREKLPEFAYGGAPAEVIDALVWPVRAMGIVLVSGAVASGALLARRKLWPAWAALVLAMVSWWFVYRGWMKPAANPALSGRAFAERIAALTTPQDRILVYGPLEETLVFYSRRSMEWTDQPQAALDALAAPERVVVVTTANGWAQLKEGRPEPAATKQGEGTVGDETFVVVTNRP